TMGIRMASAWLKWFATLALVGNVLGLAYLIHTERKERETEGAAGEKEEQGKEDKTPVEVKLKAEVIDSIHLKVEPVRAEGRWYEPVAVYGRVVPNPMATVEVRAPFAGTLQEAITPWPAPGQWVQAGQTLARIDIRVGPQERLELQNKLNEARTKH